ncbi:hypothetical protein IGI37_002762 [Enterococcus sp. AZ194]|uniref:hypothetical protein n=1 Tax=Enterococcus sp. AZ194 TaxID=2774629 RepID=UPI003F26C16F
MSISLNRVSTLCIFKMKATFSNMYTLSFLLLPLLVVVAMPLVAQDSNETAIYLMAAQLSVLFNLVGAALTVPIIQMAEEKEKYTLRTLMVSSVTAWEYLISSIFPTFLLSFLTQFLILVFSKVTYTTPALVVYLLTSAGAIAISCLIGMCFGLFAKNQLQASMLPMPIMLAMVAIPVLAKNNETLSTIQSFLYTDIITEQVSAMFTKVSYDFSVKKLLVLLVELLIAIIGFIVIYKRNGFESD